MRQRRLPNVQLPHQLLVLLVELFEVTRRGARYLPNWHRCVITIIISLLVVLSYLRALAVAPFESQEICITIVLLR